jgi:hypothetical protein
MLLIFIIFSTYLPLVHSTHCTTEIDIHTLQPVTTCTKHATPNPDKIDTYLALADLWATLEPPITTIISTALFLILGHEGICKFLITHITQPVTTSYTFCKHHITHTYLYCHSQILFITYYCFFFITTCLTILLQAALHKASCIYKQLIQSIICTQNHICRTAWQIQLIFTITYHQSCIFFLTLWHYNKLFRKAIITLIHTGVFLYNTMGYIIFFLDFLSEAIPMFLQDLPHLLIYTLIITWKHTLAFIPTLFKKKCHHIQHHLLTLLLNTLPLKHHEIAVLKQQHRYLYTLIRTQKHRHTNHIKTPTLPWKNTQTPQPTQTIPKPPAKTPRPLIHPYHTCFSPFNLHVP